MTQVETPLGILIGFLADAISDLLACLYGLAIGLLDAMTGAP